MNTDAATPLRLWMVTAGLSVIAALLGYVGLTYYLNERPEYAGAEPFDRVYYTLQLFILSPTPLGGPPYGPMLSIAMYLAPLTTVLAVLQAVSAVFRARFAAWVLLRKRGHSVVVGAGPAAFVLARRLAATRPTVLVGSRIGSDVASRGAVRVVDGTDRRSDPARGGRARRGAGICAGQFGCSQRERGASRPVAQPGGCSCVRQSRRRGPRRGTASATAGRRPA